MAINTKTSRTARVYYNPIDYHEYKNVTWYGFGDLELELTIGNGFDYGDKVHVPRNVIHKLEVRWED